MTQKYLDKKVGKETCGERTKYSSTARENKKNVEKETCDTNMEIKDEEISKEKNYLENIYFFLKEIKEGR